MGFQLERHAFVATATAIGLIVDGARLPVYLATAGREMAAISGLIGFSVIGGLIGTFLGTRLLRKVPERIFHRVVGLLIFLLGVFMLMRAVWSPGK
jgi:hypothetical protein